MEEKHQTLKELPVSERPYEKCEKNGTAMLSDAELLAVILRSGTKNHTAIDLATKILSIDPFYVKRRVAKDSWNWESQGDADSVYCRIVKTAGKCKS